MRSVSIAAFVALASIAPTEAQAPAQSRGRGGGQPVQTIQMVKPGLYVVPGGGANSIVRVTSEGVILVDTKLPGEASYNGLIQQIRSVTDQPVKVVIVTHHHADHTGNNDRFISAGAQVVGHQQLAANLDTYEFNPRPAKPTVTYTTDRTVRLGGVEVRVLHPGRSHTGGDSVVYFPDLKVVATSDAVTVGGQGPLVDYAGAGSALEWTPALDAMLALDFDTAIPGAGAVSMTRADVQSFRTKFSTVIGRAAELVRKGVAKDQLLSQLRTDDIGWTMRVPQIDSFYEEISRASR